MDRSQANAHIAQLGQVLGLSDLALDEEGVCMLALGDDELFVTLGLDALGGLRLMICLDDVVPEGGQLAELMAENFSPARTEGGVFALLPETGALVLHRRCGEDEFKAGGLADVVAGLARVARHWRARLQAPQAPQETHSFLGDRA